MKSYYSKKIVEDTYASEAEIAAKVALKIYLASNIIQLSSCVFYYCFRSVDHGDIHSGKEESLTKLRKENEDLKLEITKMVSKVVRIRCALCVVESTPCVLCFGPIACRE